MGRRRLPSCLKGRGWARRLSRNLQGAEADVLRCGPERKQSFPGHISARK